MPEKTTTDVNNTVKATKHKEFRAQKINVGVRDLVKAEVAKGWGSDSDDSIKGESKELKKRFLKAQDKQF